MDILITGCAGFIGSHLGQRFLLNDHNVSGIDNYNDFYDKKIKQKNIERVRDAATQSDGSFELVRGDIRDEDTINELVSRVDVVFHQAAQAGVRVSAERPKEVTDINVLGTLSVLNAARDHDVERVVLASSSSVYGKPESLPYEESHPTKPVSPYGVSKLASEHYARVYHELYDLSTVALRYFTVYGPRMRPNMAVSNFVSNCVNGEAPTIYGDGSQSRDLTYVKDITKANEKLLTTDEADGMVLNIGSGDNITIKELASLIRDEIDPNLGLEYSTRHEADAEHTHADISRAEEVINYSPEYSIKEGVSEFIDWFRENQSWYEDLVE